MALLFAGCSISHWARSRAPKVSILRMRCNFRSCLSERTRQRFSYGRVRCCAASDGCSYPSQATRTVVALLDRKFPCVKTSAIHAVSATTARSCRQVRAYMRSPCSQPSPLPACSSVQLTRSSRITGGAYCDRHGETSRCCSQRRWSRLAATAAADSADSVGYDNHAKVLVIGGSGRVGGSTVRALRQLAGPNLQLAVGGRSERNFAKSVEVRTYKVDPRERN